MIVKRLGPLSFAKVSGFLYAIIGLFVGMFLALVSIVGGAASELMGGSMIGALFGIGAVVVLPIVYGSLGFLGSLLMAALYNWAAGLVGGIELEIDQGAQGVTPEQGV